MFKHLLILIISIEILSCSWEKPIVRNALQGAFPKFENSRIKPNDFSLEIKPIYFDRTKFETIQPNRTTINCCIPFPLSFMNTTGPIFCNPRYYDSNLKNNMNKLLKNVIDSSRLFSNSNHKIYIVKPTLLHLYGVSYMRSYHAYVSTKDNFFPTGFSMMKLEIFNKKNQKKIGEKIITGTYLYNQNDTNMTTDHIMVNIKSYCALQSLKKLMSQIPYSINQIISGEENINNINENSKIEAFTILRLTTDYNFEEKVTIQYNSGKIISDVIEKRIYPIISKPNEWIISPINSKGQFMGPKDYKNFVEIIKKKYSGVGFTDNLNAASFSK